MHHEEIPEETAKAIWRRAAELQADAEYRMEERARRLTSGTGAGGFGGLRAGEVEAAAIEAGISPEFVHIALAEMSVTEPGGEPLTGWEERGARLMLGGLDDVQLTRLLSGSVDEVSATLLRVFQALPYTLMPRDVIDLPSGAGRVLVFGVPRYDWSNMSNATFVTNAYMIGLRRVRATIRPLPGEAGRCEVLLTGDLRGQARGRWRMGAATSAAIGLGGGGIGAAAGAGLAVGGALLSLPVLAGFAVAAGITTAAWNGSVRYYRRLVEEMLDEALATVSSNLRASSFYRMPDSTPEMLEGGG